MDFTQLIRQAQEIGEKTKQQQESLAKLRIESSSGGGMVKTVITGDGKIIKLEIEKSVIDPNDSELLTDLIVAAINDAYGKLAAERAKQLTSLAGGFDLNSLGIDFSKLL